MLVALVLEHNGTGSQQELAAESLLSEWTIRLGLEELQNNDLQIPFSNLYNDYSKSPPPHRNSDTHNA